MKATFIKSQMATIESIKIDNKIECFISIT